MNHGIKGRKFGRYTAHRTSMFRNLAAALIMHERINTTLPKAKDLRPIVEKMLTIAKKGTLAARKQLISECGGDRPEVGKLISNLAERFRDRQGGYLRIMKNGHRKGDCAAMAIIEFVEIDPQLLDNVSVQNKEAAV